jgi:hypothetical protein
MEWEMSRELGNGKGVNKMVKDDDNEKNEKFNFEFINDDEIESVKRGRKAELIAEMVAFFAKAKVNQTVKVQILALDSALDAESKKKMKATNSAKIRSHAKAANWGKVSISWDIHGVPFAKRKA